MTTMDVARAEIKAALDTLDPQLARGFLYRPTAPRAGDGWPMLDGLERDAGDAFMVTWRVRVHLPQDEASASIWIDAHLDAVYDALAPALYIESVRPTLVATSSGDQYALDFTGRRE